MYNLDFEKIIRSLLPPKLRNSFWIALIFRLLSPVRINHAATRALYVQHNYELRFSSQILSMATFLNQFYGAPLSGAGSIYIKTQGTDRAAAYTFFQNENRPNANIIYFDSELQSPFYTYFDSELQGDVDFIVYVPSTIAYDPAQLSAIVNRYKLAGKRFSIENI